MITILFLSANPANTDPLKLSKEFNKIEEELQFGAGKKDVKHVFKIERRDDISLHDLRKQVLNHDPQIVHFSGHGSSRSSLIFKNEEKGDVEVVPSGALAEFFERLSKGISLVFLNACYSEEQARAISKHIDFVIGMSNAIPDYASITFATSFYSSLALGKSIGDAFDLAITDLKLFSIPEEATPHLLVKENIDRARPFFDKVNDQSQLVSLINILENKYSEVLDNVVTEEDLWSSMKVVRDKLKGIQFINKEKELGDLDLLWTNSSTLKKNLHDARLIGDDSEANNMRNRFLVSAGKYIETMSNISNKLQHEGKLD